MRIVHWAIEEFRKVRGGFLFFASIFTLMYLTEHIMGGTHILVPTFSRAIVGGLIAAKVLLIVDHFAFAERYRHKPLAYSIVWKAALYFLVAQLILALEPAVRALIHGGLGAAGNALVEHFSQPRIWAVSLWLVFLLLGFVALRELSRALGRSNIHKLMWGR